MALTLTPGSEMRLDGAPDQLLPYSQDRIQAIAARLVEEDVEGTLFGGDIRNAIPNATQIVIEEDRARMAGRMAGADATAAARSRDLRDARGVVPEDLPPGEFGVATGRTVQEANRPLDAAEAAYDVEANTAADITRGLREGRRNWDAEGQYQFLQERGEQNPLATPGQRDVDLRRKIMQRRGQFFETADGNVIPVGRAPTAADLRNEREWEGWVGETPGSERQAIYDPQGYETFREGVRQDIQDDARQNMADFGTGVSDPAVREDLGLPPLTPKQKDARAARDRSEARVREAQLGRFADERRRADAGLPAAELGENPTAEQMEAAAFRRRLDARQASKDRRQARVAQRGELRGDGLPYAVGNMRNRFDELIERLGQENLTDWQRAGIIAGLTPNAETANPTPLGRDAVGAQNALRWFTAAELAGMDPTRRKMAEEQFKLTLRETNPDLAGQQDVIGGNTQSREANVHLDALAARFDTTPGGFSYQDEAALAQELQKPPYSMSQPDAEELAFRLAERRRWLSGGTPGGRPRQGAAPAAPPAPAAPAQPPSGLDFAPGSDGNGAFF